MSAFNPLRDHSALIERLQTSDGLIVVCYCAAWCDTCNDYKKGFDALAAVSPQHTFVWIDIEDSPELLGDEDIENFPTVAIQTAQRTLFFGPLPPHAEHLDRLLRHAGESTHEQVAGGVPPLVLPMLLTTAQ